MFSTLPLYSFTKDSQRRNIDFSHHDLLKKITKPEELVRNLDVFYSYRHDELSTVLMKENINEIHELFKQFIENTLILVELAKKS